MSRLVGFDRLASFLRPTSFMIHLQPMTLRGPRTFSGRAQVGAPDAGFWSAKASFDLIESDEILEWRGVVGDMQGGLRPYIFGVFDEQQAPTDKDLLSDKGPGVPHSNEQFFDTGVGYRQSGIFVRLSERMKLGDTTVTFTVLRAGDLRRGMYFSIDGCLYMITRPPTKSGDEVTVRFLPPARIAVDNGSEVEFADPTILMELADPSSGRLDLSGIWTGKPEIDLVESSVGLS